MHWLLTWAFYDYVQLVAIPLYRKKFLRSVLMKEDSQSVCTYVTIPKKLLLLTDAIIRVILEWHKDLRNSNNDDELVNEKYTLVNVSPGMFVTFTWSMNDVKWETWQLHSPNFWSFLRVKWLFVSKCCYMLNVAYMVALASFAADECFDLNPWGIQLVSHLCSKQLLKPFQRRIL